MYRKGLPRKWKWTSKVCQQSNGISESNQYVRWWRVLGNPDCHIHLSHTQKNHTNKKITLPTKSYQQIKSHHQRNHTNKKNLVTLIATSIFLPHKKSHKRNHTTKKITPPKKHTNEKITPTKKSHQQKKLDNLDCYIHLSPTQKITSHQQKIASRLNLFRFTNLLNLKVSKSSWF